MGVMSCSRPACNRIMCDTYVSNIGYVCPECQEEFKEYLGSNGLKPTTVGEIEKELEEFMKTRKGSQGNSTETTVNEFFNNNTK